MKFETKLVNQLVIGKSCKLRGEDNFRRKLVASAKAAFLAASEETKVSCLAQLLAKKLDNLIATLEL